MPLPLLLAKVVPRSHGTLMRHKSYQTTQVYINMVRQIDEAVAMLHVPDVLKGKALSPGAGRGPAR